jgi:hypothetical protein
MVAPARRDHDRHRRREAERARAGDDEDGHGVDERVVRRGAGPTAPSGERDRAAAITAGTNRLDARRRGAGWARGCAGPRDHSNDLREQRLGADALGAS